MLRSVGFDLVSCYGDVIWSVAMETCCCLQWLRLGINISNFPMSLSAVGFHVGLGGEPRGCTRVTVHFPVSQRGALSGGCTGVTVQLSVSQGCTFRRVHQHHGAAPGLTEGCTLKGGTGITVQLPVLQRGALSEGCTCFTGAAPVPTVLLGLGSAVACSASSL